MYLVKKYCQHWFMMDISTLQKKNLSTESREIWKPHHSRTPWHYKRIIEFEGDYFLNLLVIFYCPLTLPIFSPFLIKQLCFCHANEIPRYQEAVYQETVAVFGRSETTLSNFRKQKSSIIYYVMVECQCVLKYWSHPLCNDIGQTNCLDLVLRTKSLLLQNSFVVVFFEEDILGHMAILVMTTDPAINFFKFIYLYNP